MPRKAIYVVEGYDEDDHTTFTFWITAYSRQKARDEVDEVIGLNATITRVVTLQEEIEGTRRYLADLKQAAKPGGVARIAAEWTDQAHQLGFVRVKGKWVHEDDTFEIDCNPEGD